MVSMPGTCPARELAVRDYELVAKRSGNQALQAELERIVAVDSSVQVARLDAVAEVRRGVRYERRFTIRTRPAWGSAPGSASRRRHQGHRHSHAILVCQRRRQGTPDEDDVLRAGDVVVTTSGVVGKVGLISDVAVGSLATNDMAIVRARQGLTPHFVANLLRSPTYRNWLSGHARGTTVRHLSIRTLCSVPIPVPPVPGSGRRDRRLGRNCWGRVGCAGPTAPGHGVPSPVWLETPIVARLAAGRFWRKSDRIGALSAAADALLSLVAKSTRGTELASTERGRRHRRLARRGAPSGGGAERRGLHPAGGGPVSRSSKSPDCG